MSRSVDIVIGLQAGSEGKGKVIQYLSDHYDFAIRVGGYQAGHTLYHNGRKHANRILPCSWVNPRCVLVIGAGAFISEEVLAGEIAEIEQSGMSVRQRLYIDPRATIVEER